MNKLCSDQNKRVYVRTFILASAPCFPHKQFMLRDDQSSNDNNDSNRPIKCCPDIHQETLIPNQIPILTRSIPGPAKARNPV